MGDMGPDSVCGTMGDAYSHDQVDATNRKQPAMAPDANQTAKDAADRQRSLSELKQDYDKFSRAKRRRQMAQDAADASERAKK